MIKFRILRWGRGYLRLSNESNKEGGGRVRVTARLEQAALLALKMEEEVVS